MITGISLKEIATYDRDGAEFQDLKKINFIYGTNGSGKTTISNFLSDTKQNKYAQCRITWQNALPLRTLVYNKDFREKNFGNGQIDGVFTLGQATKEEIEEIEAKVKIRQQHKQDWENRKETHDKKVSELAIHEEDFRETVWRDIYKKNEGTFKDAFSGFMTKENFKKKILEEYASSARTLKTREVLTEKANTIFGQPPTALNLLGTFDPEKIIALENDPIWQKKIIGKADVNIAQLIQRLNMNDWVNTGREFLEETGDTCPFCQQNTITSNFRDQLESYFDQTFLTDTAKVGEQAASYQRETQNLLAILNQITVTEEQNAGRKLDLTLFKAYVHTFSTQILSNQEQLNNKIKEPSRSIELISVKVQLENISNLITAANDEINKHNQIVVNFARERQELVADIWRLLIDDHQAMLKQFVDQKANLEKAIKGIETTVRTAKQNYHTVKQEIINLSDNVTSVQPSINKINKTLRAFGFRNFEIVPSPEKNKYQIKRQDGEIAETTLSEGEITFITFLYFLQLCKGGLSEQTITEDRILIVDDPISSLDSNVLYVVSSLVKEIIKDIKKGSGSIKQLILLTHNTYFHKEVSFIDGRTKDCADTAFWILRKNSSQSELQAHGRKNPIQTAYQLLWKELQNRQHSSPLTLQNTMRRIIEHYFKILGKLGDDQIIQQFEDQDDQQICRSLLCWINDGSHTIPDDLFVEQPEDVTERYFEVFKKIFEHSRHQEHYLMMMGEPS
ncbi:wobble nucleotide-excising tRNase [Mucilaginibacter yixingensis]|uniref:Wobble nucleotide-excising tRNase n=1 Tax=Mucilaginibacter yixingensis TaxID=1295612 RepID=A0A2T5J4G7_9SPHI|nr:AAA family ATPase [Mucilaginibacter yixingensis]PTQ92406.1 wobble nucleotide-excising tRNase [Mucilaginibacter yixingensis]